MPIYFAYDSAVYFEYIFFFSIPKQKFTYKIYVIGKNCKVLIHRFIVDIFSSSLYSHINKFDHTDSTASLY